MQRTLYKHHGESVENMIKHYRENIDIKALFLIGSVAVGTERPDSDIDAVAIVSKEYYEQKKNSGELEEVYYGKCTYECGYFNIHYMTRENLEEISQSGTEPMRNMFDRARILYCDEPDLPELVDIIPVFQKNEAEIKKFRFYCAMKMFHTYYWVCCKPDGFMRLHVANGIIYNLYRLILLENEILFPSVRKLEEYVNRAPDKPNQIIQKCERFMKSLSDEDCVELIRSYEMWTAYDYPKNHNIIMNNFSNPYEYDL